MNTDVFNPQSLFDDLPVGAAVVSPEQRFVRVNEALCRLTGYSAAELTARHLPDILHPDDRNAGMEQVQRLAAGEIHAYRVDLRCIRQGGEPVWVDLAGRAMTDSAGQPRSCLLVMADITTRKEAEHTLQKGHDQLMIRRRVDAELTRHLDIEYVLRMALDTAMRLSAANAGFIGLAEDDRIRLTQAIGYRRVLSDVHLPENFGIAGRVMRQQQGELIADVAADPDYVAIIPETRAKMVIPLISRERLIGILNLETNDPARFTEDVFESLNFLTGRIATAIQNAQLYEQARELAALEERQRLARDLHDAISQTLFSMGIIAEMMLHLWDQKDPASVRQRLEELLLLTRGAQAEMRTLLLELRPAALSETTLLDLLRQLTTAAMSRTGIQVDLDTGSQYGFPTDVKIALYRIAQEALNNVIKHSEADKLTVSLKNIGNGVELSINDNGQGFYTTSTPQDRLGLNIMRERAQAIGATLTITSAPGQGTRVVTVWREVG